MTGLEVVGIDAVFAPVYTALDFKDVAGFLHPYLFSEGFGDRLLLVFLMGGVIMRSDARHHFFKELIHTE